MNTTIETLKEMEFVTYVAAGSLIALVLMSVARCGNPCQRLAHKPTGLGPCYFDVRLFSS